MAEGDGYHLDRDGGAAKPGPMRSGATIAVLFADVSGSTRLYERLGNLEAARLVAHALSVLTKTAEARNGTLRRTIGDEVLCTFPEPGDALLAAMEMQSLIRSDPVLADHKLSIRVGMHAGDVHIEGGELFGDAVNVAARMTALARSGQIISTRDMADLFPAQWAQYFRGLPSVKVRGKRQTMEVVEVLWQSDSSQLTRVLPRELSVPVSPPCLRLMHGGEAFDVGPQSVPFVLGRDDQSDLTVHDSDVSRKHATIELHDRTFVLVDHSTNGTVLTMGGDGEVIRLFRSQVQLPDRGRIVLGQSPASGSVIDFCRVEE